MFARISKVHEQSFIRYINEPRSCNGSIFNINCTFKATIRAVYTNFPLSARLQ